jgi:hypothetical protein
MIVTKLQPKFNPILFVHSFKFVNYINKLVKCTNHIQIYEFPYGKN